MDEQRLTPRGLLRSIIAEVARDYRIEPEQIENIKCRLKKARNARAVVAKRLLATGLPEKRIAQMMHLSLPVVQGLLGRRPAHTRIREECL
jgi:hypothetical protein